MKDYRLSELQAYCERRAEKNDGVINCAECDKISCCRAIRTERPANWDIERREVFELPCIIKNTYGWVVVHKENGVLASTSFALRSQADMYYKELKKASNEV